MRYYLYSDLTLPNFHSEHFVLRPLQDLAKETQQFPIPKEECYPVLPENLLLHFCQKATKLPAFFIQSADYTLWNNPPHLLSEQDALLLARHCNVRLYHDEISNSAYFCYMEENQTQHMVWVEDGFHLLKKLKFLQKNGISELALPINQKNLQTVLSLIRMLQ